MFWISLVAHYCTTVTKETWKGELTEAFVLDACIQPESAAIMHCTPTSGVRPSEGKGCSNHLKQKIHESRIWLESLQVRKDFPPYICVHYNAMNSRVILHREQEMATTLECLQSLTVRY